MYFLQGIFFEIAHLCQSASKWKKQTEVLNSVLNIAGFIFSYFAQVLSNMDDFQIISGVFLWKKFLWVFFFLWRVYLKYAFS